MKSGWVALAKLTDSDFNRLLNEQSVFQEKARALLKDGEFLNAITYSTQKKDHVEKRYEKMNALIKEVLND